MTDGEPRASLVSIVIPVHDEVVNVPIVWTELREVLDTLERPAEVIFVDDGSTDGTDEVIRRLVKHDPRIRGRRLRTRYGLKAAFHAGYDAARGDVIVT